MNRKQALYMALIGVAVLGMSSLAWAWDFSSFSQCGLSSYWYPPSSFHAEDTVPYFILHPPVYYSYAVRRPYGFSPYPYPPYVATPERRPVGPLVQSNPYVCMEVGAAAEPTRAGRHPLRIQNPFVTQEVASNTVPANETPAKPAVEADRALILANSPQ
jgi:hypothetical protein